ncbi:transcriptional regulator [Zoogloea sp.]|uniref:P-II family nitrogen regulator n=1 Tax=Zoogloea sp. TaxID=49181 RepID=UPI001AD034C9|nr:transcriptional regulator [Zoogloea sp.]MBN8283826.1 transcriptional regulator [Zoogloea sp.]
MSPALTSRKLVTIICEAELEALLVPELARHGARGYTLTEARGQGARGVRDGAWRASSNIRIEVLCDATVAERLVDMLQARFYADYGIVVFVVDAAVLRPGKF